MSEQIEYYKSQIALARTEIKNLRQQLSSLKHEHLKQIQAIKSTLDGLKCANCAESATQYVNVASNQSNSSVAQNVPTTDDITYTPIGVIETTFQNKRGVPRQPTVMSRARGAVVIDLAVFNNPEHALCGLEEFSHMWIIFHFHSTEARHVAAKVSPPRLGGERRGVFATRSPHRPCAVGLSLVKIHSIEGNKIHFYGVDMVNGTPVLDIKPFIPQYDHPASFTTMSEMERPPTEGISDAADNMAALQISVDGQNLNAIAVDTGSPFSPSSEELQEATSLMTPVSPADTPTDLRSPMPASRPDYERGAPDGQERFTPPQSASITNMLQDGIRVAPWISNPISQPYEVRFTEDVDNRLVELIGDRSQSFKTNIQCLLSEDPRSNYVRTRYPDHEYSCLLEDLSVSCIFDSALSVCTIIAVRNAEEMNN